MTIKLTIKTENLFVHGQSVEADVWVALDPKLKIKISSLQVEIFR